MDVPRVPVSTLQYCWFELVYHMKIIVQDFLTLQEAKPKTKANAVYLKSLHRLTADAELLVKYRSEMEAFQEEAEVKTFQVFNREDVKDLAKHLTMLDFEIFKRISAKEWNAKTGRWQCPERVHGSNQVRGALGPGRDSESRVSCRPSGCSSKTRAFEPGTKDSALLQHAQGSHQWDVVSLDQQAHLDVGHAPIPAQEQVRRVHQFEGILLGS